MKALTAFEQANATYLNADSACERAKKLFECNEAEFIRQAEGTSEAEKKRNAKLSDEYKAGLEYYMEVYKEKNMARAAKEGADARVNTLRSILSYERELVGQGVYQPKDPLTPTT